METARRYDLPGLLFLLAATFSGLVIILIAGFLLYIAWPVLSKEGLHFITGTVWDYNTHQYGILYLIVGTVTTTALTLIIAVPLSVCTAVYLAEWAPRQIQGVMKTLIELLVGIPSVVYGIFGYFVLAGIFRDYINPGIDSLFGFIPFFRIVNPHSGLSMLLSAIVLSFMIIPIIVALTFEALKTVPGEIKEASYALGATKWDTIKRIALPAAFTGIVTATILGLMRAMGETMAVVMLSGSTGNIPSSILDSTYMMTSKILHDISDYMASAEPRSALFGIAVVLFLMEVVFVALIRLICSRYGDRTP